MGKYNSVKIEECAAWVRIHGLQDNGGATVKDFCRDMGISKETFYKWMNESDFSDAIKKAKETFKDSLEKRLVDSLLNSAIGYEVEETKSEYITGKDGNPVIKKQTRTSKHIQPNTGAAIFLLTNIAPDKWKNKLNTEHSGAVDTGMTFIVENEEQKELIKQIKDR